VDKTETGLTVKRELEEGWFQSIELPTPAVLTIQSGGNKLRYATLMGIKRAKTKEVRIVTASELAVDAIPVVVLERVALPQKPKIHPDAVRHSQRSCGGAGGKTEIRSEGAMSGIWVVIEERDARVSRGSWEAVAAGQKLAALTGQP